MLICSVFYYNFIRSGIHAIFKRMQKQKRGKNETRKSMEKSNNYQSVEQGVGTSKGVIPNAARQR